MKRTRKKEKKTQKRGCDRKREEDGQKNDQKCLKFRRDLAEGKRNVQHQKHRSALRALKNEHETLDFFNFEFEELLILS